MALAVNRFTLWRYISWRFAMAVLATFGGSLILLFLISIIDILPKANGRNEAGVFTLITIALYRTPALSEQMLPFSVLVSSMASFLNLSRHQELVVARSIGVSVWQILLPALAAVWLIGVLAVTLYNPAAALLMEEKTRLEVKHLGSGDSLLSSTNSGLWLRQEGVDGQTVLRARSGQQQGQILNHVTMFVYDKQGKFSERIEAPLATLGFGSWEFTDAWVISVNSEPQFYKSYLVTTYLTREQVRQSIGNPETVSFWNLPVFISAAERAGVSAAAYKFRYQSLLSLPFLLCAMALIGATVSLKVFRFGKIGIMVVAGLSAGLALFLSNEIMRDLGTSEILPPMVAVWLPVLITGLAGTTILLYQEDG